VDAAVLIGSGMLAAFFLRRLFLRHPAVDFRFRHRQNPACEVLEFLICLRRVLNLEVRRRVILWAAAHADYCNIIIRLTSRYERATIAQTFGENMATSKTDASKAGRLLQKPKTPASVKSVAASDLAQAKRHGGGKKK
jgi:hypothetical protein